MVQVSRFRVVVTPDRTVALNPHHAALVYATLSTAYGLATSHSPMLPDGIIVEAPEQGRIEIKKGHPFALGWSLIAAGTADARLRSTRLVDGLRRLAATSPKRKSPLSGGFQILAVEDFLSGQPFSDQRPPTAIDDHAITEVGRELAPALGRSPIAIRFYTPLRMSRPKSKREINHGFLDDHWFDTAVLFRRIRTRLSKLGLGHLCPEPDPAGHQPERGSLVWIDIPYAGAKGRKTLGGVVGTVPLPPIDPAWALPLAWTQILGVGESTTMGLGRFELIDAKTQTGLLNATTNESPGEAPHDENPAPRSHACDRWQRGVGPLPRSRSLLDLALDPISLDHAAARYGLTAGTTVVAADAIRKGSYQSDQTQSFHIPRRDGSARRLRIPSKRDRALQQAVLESIAPALDRFFESSSHGYRKGLGRHTAARRIARVSKQGFRWAVRSDIHQFFDSVDHEVLRRRIVAYLPDPPLVDLLMHWVIEGVQGDGVGLPTGAPVSPVLANLLLDRFDELVAQEGAQLVRYADDFLILHRSEESAQAALDVARQAAESLKLQLGDPKTDLLGPNDSFDFLGFRFSPDDHWRFHSLLPVTELAGLGWVDLSQKRSSNEKGVPVEQRMPLPGESGLAKRMGGGVAVLSGRVRTIDGRKGELMLLDRVDRTISTLDTRRISFVVIQGTPQVTSAAWRQIIDGKLDLMMVGRSGRPRCQIQTRPARPRTDARAAQVACAADPTLGLAAARALIHAKLVNTAKLARALKRGNEAVMISERLLDLSESALMAKGHDQLLGYEGSGAAIWYGFYGQCLPKGMKFRKRQSPRAHTAGNVLLNIAHTHVHRLCHAAAVASGLMPDLGLLHRPRSGHLALASDLQEPFRHLADRAVFLASQRIRKDDFQQSEGAYPLTLSPRAMRHLFDVLYRTMALGCTDASGVSGSYREHVYRQARRVCRHLEHPRQSLIVFRHP